jgi:hypothetical protein
MTNALRDYKPKLITYAWKLEEPWVLASLTFIGQSPEDYESQNQVDGITFSEGGSLMEIRAYEQISPAEDALGREGGGMNTRSDIQQEMEDEDIHHIAQEATQKLLVIGYGRHGKDTVCEILRDHHGYRFTSSSRFVFEECIWKSLWCARYPDKEACYEDRGNHRDKWFNMIAEYNTPDKSRTVTGMFAEGYNIYCGLRSREEFEASRHLFDKIVWVDRHMFQAPEPSSSMELTAADATHILDNNGTLQDLERNVAKLVGEAKEPRVSGHRDSLGATPPATSLLLP